MVERSERPPVPGFKMRLTSFSGYTLRVLMYAAAHPDRQITTGT
jgi:hypothetical protein